MIIEDKLYKTDICHLIEIGKADPKNSRRIILDIQK